MSSKNNIGDGIAIYGKNTVIEALKSGSRISKLFIYEGLNAKERSRLESLARGRRVRTELSSKEGLERLCETRKNQGVAALLHGFQALDLKRGIAYLEKCSGPRLVVVLDSISDPQNLGAIIRTCSAAGTDLLVMNASRSSPISGTVFKVSEGGIFHQRVSVVANLNEILRRLKKMGFWVYGFEASAKDTYFDIGLLGDVALVFGSEGVGLRELTKKSCDMLLKIPIREGISSLNVSVSVGLGVYEVLRQRRLKS